VKKLLAAWLCVALVACAMGGKKAAAPMTPAAQSGAQAPSPTTPEEKRAEITRLSDEITGQQQHQAAIPAAPTPMSAGSATCTDVCNFSRSICDNSDKICKLADELQPDDWATGKCNDARQACSDAKKRCTDCGG
jgi:hypothetical protein